jgi:hypothetical protein
VSAASVTIRYDGPILAGHRMDVADLAPALLGLSELCKIANRKFNRERAAVQVLIGTDVEHKCFQFDLQVLQTLWDQTKTFLANDDVKTAKDILEWLGLLSTAGGGILGVFGLLKYLKGRKVTSTNLEMIDGRNVVRITIEGDNNTVVVHPQTAELLRDESVIANAQKVVQPLMREGYETVEFESAGNAEKIGKTEAAGIVAASTSDIEAGATDAPQTITAWVTVYSPVYDVKAPRWRFKFGDVHEYMDIRDTQIVEMALMRGGALVDDAYRVELEITQEHKPNGTITNHYKIKKVLEFRPSKLPYQSDWISSNLTQSEHPTYFGPPSLTHKPPENE